MKRALLSAGLLCLAVALAPAVAQPPGPISGGSFPGGLNTTGTAPVTDSMQENVEILRRLLDKALLESYGFPAHNPLAPKVFFSGLPAGMPGVSDEFVAKNIAGDGPQGDPHAAAGPHTEGVYLKDYGVVFTATLPLPPFSVVGGTGASPAGKQAPDEWDRIRKEIHGEAPDQGAQAVPGHTPLSEVILKVLADNAKHFNNLGQDMGPAAEDKKITVAVTFRGAATCGNCHQNLGGSGPIVTFGLPQTPPGPAGQPGAGGFPAAPDGSGTPGAPQFFTDARNDILLGDLHMKQGKPQEAIEAYHKAAQQVIPGLRHTEQTEPGLTHRDVPALLAAVDIGNKLAAAYMAAGDDNRARGALKETAEFAKQAERLTGVAVPVGPATPPATQALPSKLVVTATKKQLDDVASGKLTFEAFCKAATVEYVTPPADKK